MVSQNILKLKHLHVSKESYITEIKTDEKAQVSSFWQMTLFSNEKFWWYCIKSKIELSTVFKNEKFDKNLQTSSWAKILKQYTIKYC